MRLYAHWLDQEYMNPSNRMGVDHNAWGMMAERLLRLLALFGIPIVISDPQLLSSAPILALFRDTTGYESLLSADPTFIKLKARAEPGVPEPQKRTSVALAGFRRVLQSPYNNNNYRDFTALEKVADFICSEGQIDAERLATDPNYPITKIVNNTDEHTRKLLKGALNAAIYMAYGPNPYCWSALEGEAVSYYAVLRESLERPREKLHEQDERALHVTLDFLSREMQSEAGLRVRSPAIARLIKMDNAPAVETIYGTIVNAWNNALEKSLGSDYGAERRLPRAAMLGPYLKRVAGVVLPEVTSEARCAIVTNRSVGRFLSADYSYLEWAQIAQVIRDTRMTRERFQSALAEYRKHFYEWGTYVADPEADAAAYVLNESFLQHARAVAASAAQFHTPLVESWLWMLAPPISGVLSGVLGHLGLDLGLSIGAAIGANFVTGASQPGVKRSLRRHQEATIVHTLSADLRQLDLVG